MNKLLNVLQALCPGFTRSKNNPGLALLLNNDQFDFTEPGANEYRTMSRLNST